MTDSRNIVIHKQTFWPVELFELKVPIGTVIRYVAEQGPAEGHITVWYERPEISHGFMNIKLFVVPTGVLFDHINNRATYLSTVMTKLGLVWHIYVNYGE